QSRQTVQRGPGLCRSAETDCRQRPFFSLHARANHFALLLAKPGRLHTFTPIDQDCLACVQPFPVIAQAQILIVYIANRQRRGDVDERAELNWSMSSGAAPRSSPITWSERAQPFNNSSIPAFESRSASASSGTTRQFQAAS